MVVGNTLGCLLIGYPLAYFISRKTGRRKTLFVLLVMLPFWTSFLIRTYSWITILGDEGLLNRSCRGWGMVSTATRCASCTRRRAVYDRPHLRLPALHGAAALRLASTRSTSSLYEASNDLGAGKWTTLTQGDASR